MLQTKLFPLQSERSEYVKQDRHELMCSGEANGQNRIKVSDLWWTKAAYTAKFKCFESDLDLLRLQLRERPKKEAFVKVYEQKI